MNLNPKKSQQQKSYMNVQDQLKTIEVLALISCSPSICNVYMKFSLKIKDSTFFLIVLEKYRIMGCNIGNFRQIQQMYRKYSKILKI